MATIEQLKKEGRDIYPITTPSAVRDSEGHHAIIDAPSDGKQYARKNGAWTEIEAGGAAGIPVAHSVPATGILPDTFYDLGVITADPSITIASATDLTKDHEWMIAFSIGATAPASVTFPTSVKFSSTPVFESNKHYECSMKWDTSKNLYYAMIQSW